MTKNLLFTLKFSATNYPGIQVQKNAITVCEVFQDAVEKVFGTRGDIKGCSRTDAGVHAQMYCASMQTSSGILPERAVFALNQHLPDDIAVMDCREVPLDFHARYSCTGKEYIYKVYNSHIKDPFSPQFRYRFGYHLDETFLNTQAEHFVGTHDFAAFCSKGSDITDTVRTIYSAKVERDGEEVRFVVSGNGFLYNMVRIMAGTLIYINAGRLQKDRIPAIISSKNRSNAGKTMPAHGLHLNKVFYND